jgi:hypothetical protein
MLAFPYFAAKVVWRQAKALGNEIGIKIWIVLGT